MKLEFTVSYFGIAIGVVCKTGSWQYMGIVGMIGLLRFLWQRWSILQRINTDGFINYDRSTWRKPDIMMIVGLILVILLSIYTGHQTYITEHQHQNKSKVEEDAGIGEVVHLPYSLDEFYYKMKSQNLFTFITTSPSTWPPEMQQLVKFSAPALVYGRPLNKVMIVMVGQSGTGKSTTINNLFADNICSTSSDRSETHEVSEYGKLLCVKSESPWIKATLSFVDLPGALDVDHTKEAQNMAFIKKFRNESPDLVVRQGIQLPSGLRFFEIREEVYPNVVLMTVKASDNRMVGPDSSLQKSLKMLDEYHLLDKLYVNLIVVVTHAMTIPYRKYKAQKNKIVDNIQNAVYDVLRISNIHIVFVENMPEDYDMVKLDGSDFYSLPDGQLSHYNLIQAMISQFKTNHDLLGRLLCGWYFSDSCPEKGNKPNLLKTVSHYKLSFDEIQQAQQSLFSIGVQAVSNDNVLPELQFHVLGRGYCPRGERLRHVSVVRKNESRQVEILGKKYKAPKCVQVIQRNENHFHRLSWETKEMYANHKVASYGMESDIILLINANSRGRWVKNNDLGNSQSSSLSFLYETRLINAKMNDIENQVAEELLEVLEQLPNWYDPEDPEEFNGFFSKWGTHFVCEVWIGGSIKIDASIHGSDFTEELGTDVSKQLQTVFSLLGKQQEKTDVSFAFAEAGMKDEILTITGGKPPHVTTMKDLTSHQFLDWVESITQFPTELEYSIKLYPYYNLVPAGRQRIALRDATLEYLAGSTSEPSKRTRNNVAEEIVRSVKHEKSSTISCFPPTAKIYTTSGLVAISQLKPGDHLQTLPYTLIINGSPLMHTQFYTYLHYDPEMMAEFLVIRLQNNETLTVSEHHLIFTYEDEGVKAIPAKEIIIGKELVFVDIFSSNESIVKPTKVVDVSKSVIKGVYAPLTREGSLIVDGILVSCYAHTTSHVIAHFSMAPLRLWYDALSALKAFDWTLQYPFLTLGTYFGLGHIDQDEDVWNIGIHKYAELLMSLRNTFLY